MNINRWFALGLLALVHADVAGANTLRRRAVPGFSIGDVASGVGVVKGVVEGSPAFVAGLRAGDRIDQAGDKPIVSTASLLASMSAFRDGDTISVRVLREGGPRTLTFRPAPAPLDAEKGVSFSYEDVRNPVTGLLQRVIVSRPASASGPVPFVFFVPWLSCDSVEVPTQARGGIERLLYRIAATAGLGLVRVEKPGVGDSEGDCSRTDFETELQGARAAFSFASSHPWFVRQRALAMGFSFSGSFLPRVAPAENVAGYVFINSFVSTWFERLIRFERKRLLASGETAAAAFEKVRRLSRVHLAVLEEGLTPAQAARQHQDLSGAWTDEPEHMYGRPLSFMRQLQATDAWAAWKDVDRPTLAVFGGADTVMHLDDHEQLVSAINRNRPGAGRLILIPEADHSLNVPAAAAPRAQQLEDEMVAWMLTTLKDR